MSSKKQCDQNKPSMMGMYYDTMMGPQFELAKAYVPIQMYMRQYSPEKGLEKGTLFPELYRPYRTKHYKD